MWFLLIPVSLCSTGEDLKKDSLLSPGRRILLGAAAVGAELLLAWANYLAVSTPGGSISGMQGRFFMPGWILLCLALMRSHGLRRRMGRFGEWLILPVYLACFGINLAIMLGFLRTS